MTTSNSNVASIVIFNGEHKNWKAWSMKFMAKATLNGYKDILVGKTVPPEAKVTQDQDELRARKQNEQAYCELMLAMTNQRFLDAIIEAQTTDFPSGEGREAWRRIGAIYEPRDTATKINLMTKMSTLSLGKGDDPDDWISEMESIRRQLNKNFKSTISDEDFVIRLVENIPLQGHKELKVSFMR